MPKRTATVQGQASKKAAKAQMKKEMDRLEVIDGEMQDFMNKPYVDGQTANLLRFMEADHVIVLTGGLYYRGVVRHHYRLLPSLYPQSNDMKYRIPTYMIRFEGFGQGNDEEIPENELVSRVGDDPVAVFGMLYAHFWNEQKRKWAGKEQHEMGQGVWFMDDDVVKNLSEFWQNEFEKPCGFAEYCHHEYSPDKYIQPASPASTTSNLDDDPAA